MGLPLCECSLWSHMGLKISPILKMARGWLVNKDYILLQNLQHLGLGKDGSTLETMKFLGFFFPPVPSPLQSWVTEGLAFWRQGNVTLGIKALKSYLGSNPVFAASLLCDPGQLTYPLCVPVKQG